MITLTVLAENTVRRADLLAEHGLAFWLDTGRHRVLFDTGQGMVLRHNAGRLGIDLGTADAIVLSHGHYDHVGGLPEVLGLAPQASLWMHPGATVRRFTRMPNGKARRISTDTLEQKKFEDGRLVEWVSAPAEVVPGIHVTGPIPRQTGWEDVGGPFFLDEELCEPDPIVDDMALFVESGKGISVVLGCAHAGVINTLDAIEETIGVRTPDTILGGWHLVNANANRMDRTIKAIQQRNPRVLAPCHCTGWSATALLRSACGPLVREACVGTVLGLG